MAIHWAEVASIIGFIIITMMGIIGFGLKKWITQLEKTIAKILLGLDDIKEQIHHLQTENQLQSATIREIEGRIETRLQGMEKRLDTKRHIIGEIESRVAALEKCTQKICLLHKHNHPDDDV